MTNKHDSWRVERDVVELTERSKIVETIFTGGTDPSDWARDDEAFEGVVREAGFLAFWRSR